MVLEIPPVEAPRSVPAPPKVGVGLSLASARVIKAARLFRSMLNPPFESVRPMVLGDERHTSCIVAVSGGAVPSSMATFPERNNGRCEKSGCCVLLGTLLGCVGVVVGLVPDPPPPPGGGLTPCANIPVLNVSPSRSPGKKWVVIRNLPVYGYYSSEPNSVLYRLN